MTDDRRSRDIAIIGMSAHFARAPDLATYWQNILDEVDAIAEASDRWAEPYFDPSSTANDRIYTRKGGFLGDTVDFDPAKFGIMPNTVASADADHFLALEHAQGALADAGYGERPFDRARTGVILGRGTYVNRSNNMLIQHGQAVDQVIDVVKSLHPDMTPAALERLRAKLKATLPPFSGEVVPGLVPNVITGRIANRLDLMGPNYIVDAACASSLIAVGLAVEELRAGRCDMMLSGAINTTTPPQLYMMFCQLNGMARDALRPFDRAADGTLLGEGVGVIVLKRLEDAERDGDRIYAVIKGVGSSSDGRALGLLAPRREGQLAALRRAYAENGIDPASVSLIEAHGTGMPLGDKTEIESLRDVFGDRRGGLPRVAVGSVKSMIGHCIPAAGIASIIKTALALHDRVLPGMLCRDVNPELKLEEANLYINNRARPWVHGNRREPRRAGVNAFGFGGVNAHAILEEYRGPAPERTLHHKWPSELLLFSADDRDGLIAELARIERLAAKAEVRLADLACTLARRPRGRHRAAIACASGAELVTKLAEAQRALAAGKPTQRLARTGIFLGEAAASPAGAGLAFLFPGEGGQHVDMLAELCLHIPRVRAWFDLLDEALADAPIAPSRILFPAPTALSDAERAAIEAEITSLELGSAAVFIAGLALHDLLTSCGVNCDAMLGHSTGEGTALVASGTVRFADRDELRNGLALFGRAYRELTGAGRIERGALLTVGAVAPEVIESVVTGSAGELHVALDNCPNQVVLFGSGPAVEKASAQLAEAGAICVPLSFDRAYHTPLLAGLHPALRQLYDALEIGPAAVPVYSCVTTEPFPADADAIRELATRQWYSRVRFRDTIASLYDRGIRTFVEVGPGGKLTGFVRDILQRRPHAALASNMAGTPALLQFQLLLGALHVAGIDLTLDPLFAHRPVAPVDLDGPDNAAAGQRRGMKLDLMLPVMRLDEAAARELRSAVTVPAAAEAPGRSSSPEPSPTPEVVARPPVVIDPRLQGVQAHFGLMREFLASQARIMTRMTSVPSAAPTAMPAPNGAAVPEPPLPAGDNAWPLLGRVVEQGATRLVCERQWRIERDVMLHDHTFGPAPSATDRALTALPVVPFTISMELAAEAAHRLAGEHRRVVRLQGARGYRWLALDNGELNLVTEAELVPAAAPSDAKVVRVRVFQPADARRGDRRDLVFEAQAELADAYPASAAGPFDIGEPQAVHYTRERFYGQARPDDLRYAPLFHGPRFQAVTGLRRVGSKGIEADMTVLPTADLVAGLPDCVFQIDPIVLDAASHLVGYWVAERFGADLSFFPFAVNDFRQHAVWPKPGARILCRAAMRIVTPDGGAAGFEFFDAAGQSLRRIDATAGHPADPPASYETCGLYPANAWIEANFQFLDERGVLLAEVAGWSDRFFAISHRFYRCRLLPQQAYLSDPWMQQETSRICRRIERQREAYLEQGWGIWRRVLAHLTLSRQERAHWYALPETGPRRTEWLLGRIAAKDAVRQWAEERHGLRLAPADIEILPDSLNRPLVHCAALASGIAPVVSITHTGTAVVAAAADPADKIGIDLGDRADVRSPESLKLGFNERELALLARETTGDQHLGILRFWCAKEAASKARGTGLGGEPRNWLVDDYLPESGLLTVRYGGVSYRVRTWESGGQVLALC